MLVNRLPRPGRMTAWASRCLFMRYASTAATTAPAHPGSPLHKIVVVGGGAAGLAVSHQLLRTGRFAREDIAIIDPAKSHDYQPGWTLVGGGCKTKEELRRPLASLIDAKIKFYNDGVASFAPEQNSVTLSQSGQQIRYNQLVVVPGIAIQYERIPGLPEALADPNAPVSTIYGYETCDKVYRTIDAFQKGQAIFTQPAGLIKCAGAPQKIMWLAYDKWQQAGLYKPEDLAHSPIRITFATSLPSMFGVAKYADRLNEMRQQRGIDALFEHDLVAVDAARRTATFARPPGKADGKGETVSRPFDFLHVAPKMGAHPFVAQSPLANPATGLVDVDDATTRHKKYANVWSIGDASSLPTSKTAAAITAETPVLVGNLLSTLDGKAPGAAYNGYTSCPITTEYGKVMLAEFKYGGVPDETFGRIFGIDQATPRRAFYMLKKDFFPWVYFKSMVKGTWGGPKGFIR